MQWIFWLDRKDSREEGGYRTEHGCGKRESHDGRLRDMRACLEVDKYHEIEIGFQERLGGWIKAQERLAKRLVAHTGANV